MRLVAGFLALTLFAPSVRADDTTGPPRPAAETPRSRVPLRVVRVMPESHQALLFDRARATHVLAELGGEIEGYRVDEIDDDEVVLSREGTQVVLAAPAPRRDRAAARAPVKPADSAAPIDPYADSETRTAPADAEQPAGAPSAAVDAATGSIEPGSGGVRVARAPGGARAIEPGADGVRVAQAPVEPPSLAPSAAATASPGPSPEIRVADAPDATPRRVGPGDAVPPAASAAPGQPAVSTDGEAPPTRAPAAPPAITPPAAPPAITPPAAPPAITPPAAPPALTSPAAPPAVTPPAAPPALTDTRSLDAAGPSRATRPARDKAKSPRRTAAGKQTDDALALADVMSGGASARSARGPGADPRPVDPRPPAEAPQASEVRTAAPGDAIVLSRRDVDRALTDFAKLTGAIHASFSDTGVLVADVAGGSIFDRGGLKPGDTITSIDGTRLRSLDDAANLYARASTARSLTIQLVREGKPLTLRVAIQ